MTVLVIVLVYMFLRFTVDEIMNDCQTAEFVQKFVSNLTQGYPRFLSLFVLLVNT